MRKLIILLLMAVTSFGQSANDLLMSQRNAGNTGNIQRNIGASGAITTTATFRSALGIAGVGDANTFTAGQTFQSSINLQSTIIRSNLDTITITANAGTIDVTKGAGSATNNAATTLTMSSDAATTQSYLSRDLINSDGSNARVFTIRNAATTTIATVTVPLLS